MKHDYSVPQGDNKLSAIPRVLVMAAGTGGHIFPALVVAKALQEKGVEVAWLGTAQGMEQKLVPETINLYTIPVQGLRGTSWQRLLKAPWQLMKAALAARKILKEFQPDLVLGMGGYVTGPSGVMSYFLGIPLIIHEQNTKPGFTNRVLHFFSKQVFTAFPNTFNHSKKNRVIGNPLRESISQLPGLTSVSRPLRLLVLGGSQGATALNQLIGKALTEKIPEVELTIRHQTGDHNLQVTKEIYQHCAYPYELLPFIDDMSNAYGWANLVIARAGALTVSEIAAAGVASILIPYPYAVDDHQTSNAAYLADMGAACLVQQQALDDVKLRNMIRDFALQQEKLLQMAAKAKAMAKSDATEQIVAYCLGEINE